MELRVKVEDLPQLIVQREIISRPDEIWASDDAMTPPEVYVDRKESIVSVKAERINHDTHRPAETKLKGSISALNDLKDPDCEIFYIFHLVVVVDYLYSS